jgi:hypothetical protein
MVPPDESEPLLCELIPTSRNAVGVETERARALRRMR